MLWCPIHLFYFAKNRDVQASSCIAGKSHGYQPARCKLVLERNQPGPWVHEVLLDHQLVAVGIVFPTSHLQPTHLATWDFDAGMISQFFSPQVQVCGREEARVRYWHRDKRWIFTSFGVLLIYIEASRDKEESMDLAHRERTMLSPGCIVGEFCKAEAKWNIRLVQFWPEGFSLSSCVSHIHQTRQSSWVDASYQRQFLQSWRRQVA